MVVLTDDEDNHCRLVSVRLLGAAGVEVPRPAEEPRPQLGYRRERDKQRAAWRRGSMNRASSMPRLRVRAINWITFMTHIGDEREFLYIRLLRPACAWTPSGFWSLGGGLRENLLADLTLKTYKNIFTDQFRLFKLEK